MNDDDIFWPIISVPIVLILVAFYLGYKTGEFYTYVDIREQKQKDYYASLERENDELKRILKKHSQ